MFSDVKRYHKPIKEEKEDMKLINLYIFIEKYSIYIVLSPISIIFVAISSSWLVVAISIMILALSLLIIGHIIQRNIIKHFEKNGMDYKAYEKIEKCYTIWSD